MTHIFTLTNAKGGWVRPPSPENLDLVTPQHLPFQETALASIARSVCRKDQAQRSAGAL